MFQDYMELSIFDRYISTVMHKIYQLSEGRMILITITTTELSLRKGHYI